MDNKKQIHCIQLQHITFQPNDDYATGLSKLWGRKTLKRLRTYVRDGEIEDQNISTMASKMGCKRTYNENRFQVNLMETFERMLEEWFNRNLFDLSPSDAKDDLVKVLMESRCSNKVVYRVKRLCDSYK